MNTKNLLFLGAGYLTGRYAARTKSASIGAVQDGIDEEMITELKIYIDNNNILARQRFDPIMRNLTKKYRKGQFDVDKAAKLFMYLVNDGLQRYHKEYGGSGRWSDLLSVKERAILAKEFAREALIELKAGNAWE